MELTYNDLDELAAFHGPSFYIFYPKALAKNFEELSAAFLSTYPKTRIAYSYKTNYLPRICQLVDQMGGHAEVVSSMELAIAKKIGVKPANIFFNGPFKEPSASQEILSRGGVVNVDSMDELITLAKSSETGSCKEPWRIGIRCNFPVEGLSDSRFGIDTGSRDFFEIFEIFKNYDRLKFDGLHCHFAPRSLDCWSDTVAGILEILNEMARLSVGLPDTISLGGGLYGNMSDHLAQQFEQQPPTFSEYAKEVRPLSEYFAEYKYAEWPTLIIEPGTALVANTMDFVCRVNSIKKVKGVSVVSVSGSKFNVNTGDINPNFRVITNQKPSEFTAVENAKICGFTCIESDVIARGYTGDIALDDFVVINEVGSYSIVMKPPFILPNVPIIELGEEPTSSKIIKRKETWQDIFQTYNF